MSPDGDALLAAIRADPDDDTVRLVYADWLDERGEAERAEFIRVQCELARHPCGSVVRRGMRHPLAPTCRGCDRAATLLARERELLDLRNPAADNEHVGDAWFSAGGFGMVTHGAGGPFWLYQPAPDGSRAWDVTIRRGFVDGVACDGDEWSWHGDRLLALHPVRSVRFVGDGPTIEPVPPDAATRVLRVERFRVAGLLVEVPDEEMRGIPDASEPTHIRAVAEENARLILSRRWPRVPPAGWTFPTFGERLATGFEELARRLESDDIVA